MKAGNQGGTPEKGILMMSVVVVLVLERLIEEMRDIKKKETSERESLMDGFRTKALRG